ncbi:uncharacterized protein [Rutidosis leptorrhynchoides]|uniref:uncharacterized protein n=1 Tax=Rutidosis leptorrhynchoides TaxID=125765 RepID=UPI003A9995E5
MPPPTEPVIHESTDRLHDLLNDLREDSTLEEQTIDDDDPMNTTDAPSDRHADISELDKLDETKLYHGCNFMSAFNFLAKLIHMKVDSKWTNTSFDKLLQLLTTTFPLANIPKSHYEAKKKMSEIGLGHEVIHVCKNDCCLFWNENSKKDHCPLCKTSRWKNENTKGKKVAHKVLRYFPLTPRLQCLYKSSVNAKDMIWHAIGQCKEEGKMRHPVDGTSWKSFEARYPDFESEPINVRLRLSSDGFNPFGNMNNAYSMWPVVLKTYNVPLIYLEENHLLRQSLSFKGEIETRPHPRKRTNDEILEQLRPFSRKALQHEPGKHPKHGGRKGDVMRQLRKKNVCESLLNTLLMHKGKSKDTVKTRKVLKEWGIHSELGVKLPDGFGSNFRTKVADDDTKISGLKSHDHHLMMRRLLPISLRAFLNSFILTPLIELHLFFKQLCAQTLKISDMEAAKTQLINILCSLEQIFPPSFFDIMIHLVMHLPEEAIQGDPVYMRWMYSFEIYMKKLKNYVRNKARQEGSIAEGYVADEALTYASRPISKGDDVDLDPDTKAKNFWVVLHNNSELDKYKDVRFVVQSRDLRRTTQNSGISSPSGPGGTLYYGVLEEILKLNYLFRSNNVFLFHCKWFKTTGNNCVTKNNITTINTQQECTSSNFRLSSNLEEVAQTNLSRNESTVVEADIRSTVDVDVEGSYYEDEDFDEDLDDDIVNVVDDNAVNQVVNDEDDDDDDDALDDTDGHTRDNEDNDCELMDYISE